MFAWHEFSCNGIFVPANNWFPNQMFEISTMTDQCSMRNWCSHFDPLSIAFIFWINWKVVFLLIFFHFLTSCVLLDWLSVFLIWMVLHWCWNPNILIALAVKTFRKVFTLQWNGFLASPNTQGHQHSLPNLSCMLFCLHSERNAVLPIAHPVHWCIRNQEVTFDMGSKSFELSVMVWFKHMREKDAVPYCTYLQRIRHEP